MTIKLSTPFLPSIKPSSSPTATARRIPEEVGRWECRKRGGVHPEFYKDARVYCNGELVMTTGGTQREYTVDVWSGNHPFYLGNRSGSLVDADQVEKFRKKYGQLSSIMEIPVLRHGEIVLPQKNKKGSATKGKGKGKR